MTDRLSTDTLRWLIRQALVEAEFPEAEPGVAGWHLTDSPGGGIFTLEFCNGPAKGQLNQLQRYIAVLQNTELLICGWVGTPTGMAVLIQQRP